MEAEIKKLIATLSRRISQINLLLEKDLIIDFDEIMQKMNKQFFVIWDIVAITGAVVLFFAAGWEAAALVSAIVYVCQKVYNWFFSGPDRRKREARENALDQVDQQVSKIKNNIDSELNQKIQEVDELLDRMIKVYISNIRQGLKLPKQLKKNIDVLEVSNPA
jgi:hypothetical protein